jgi:hypothetical protein
MHSPFLLGLLLVTPYFAQPVPTAPPPRLGDGEQVLVVWGAMAGGALSTIAAGAMLDAVGASETASFLTAVAVYPVAVAGATYGLGNAFGGNGTFQGTLTGAGIGAAAGAGTGVLVGYLVVRDLENDPDHPDGWAGDLFSAVFEAIMALAI